MNEKLYLNTKTIAPQSGGWLKINQGSRLKITDVDGEQVADLFAVSCCNFDEYLSVGTTRAALYKLFPKTGEGLFSNKYRQILTIERDDSPGTHDMLYCACSTEMYQKMGVNGYHNSCSDNFRIAATEFNWHPEVIPDPVNIFQYTQITAGKMTPLPAQTKAGDSITLKAEIDLYIIVTACSMDLEPINGTQCSRIKIEIIPN